MVVNTGKTVRLHDLFNPKTGKCLLVDTSIPASIGSVEGLEDFSVSVERINNICDGIIANPGQIEHNANLFGGSRRATPLIRLDWTNYYRSSDFCLPAKTINRVVISSVDDALRLGASVGVIRYMMGFEDEFEAQNVEAISLISKDAYQKALPIFVELCPFGYKVDPHNYENVIELGMACMLEVGIDGIIIPNCAIEVLRNIGNWADIPVIVRISEQFKSENLEMILNTGLSGVMVGENVFSISNYREYINELFIKMHQ